MSSLHFTIIVQEFLKVGHKHVHFNSNYLFRVDERCEIKIRWAQYPRPGVSGNLFMRCQFSNLMCEFALKFYFQTSKDCGILAFP